MAKRNFTPSTINNPRADRINHHVAEILRELDAARGELDVIEIADLQQMIVPFKDAINKRRADSDLPPEKQPGTEVVTIEGISYRVHRTHDGTTIDTPCACLGSHQRTHNTVHCPWLAQRGEAVEEGRD